MGLSKWLMPEMPHHTLTVTKASKIRNRRRQLSQYPAHLGKRCPHLLYLHHHSWGIYLHVLSYLKYTEFLVKLHYLTTLFCIAFFPSWKQSTPRNWRAESVKVGRPPRGPWELPSVSVTWGCVWAWCWLWNGRYFCTLWQRHWQRRYGNYRACFYFCSHGN